MIAKSGSRFRKRHDPPGLSVATDLVSRRTVSSVVAAWGRRTRSANRARGARPSSPAAGRNIFGILRQVLLFPEYYGRSCLTCRGSPKGEIDITGFPKAGANEGDLAAIISIALYRLR